MKSDNLTVVAAAVVAVVVAAAVDVVAGLVVVDGPDYKCLGHHKLLVAWTEGHHFLPFEPCDPCGTETLRDDDQLQRLAAFVAFVHCSSLSSPCCCWDLCLNGVIHCVAKHYTCCD